MPGRGACRASGTGLAEHDQWRGAGDRYPSHDRSRASPRIPASSPATFDITCVEPRQCVVWAGRLYQSLLSPDGAGSSSGRCSSDSGWMSDGSSVAARMVCHVVCLTWSAGELPTRATHSVHMKLSSRCN